MSDDLLTLTRRLDVDLSVRGFRRADGDGRQVWRRDASPTMRLELRQSKKHKGERKGILRCDAVGELRLAAARLADPDELVATIDAWLGAARTDAAGLGPVVVPAGGVAAPLAPATELGELAAVDAAGVAPAGIGTASVPATLDEAAAAAAGGEAVAALVALSRDLGDARERAARAEIEVSFLRERLEEVRHTAAALAEIRHQLDTARAAEAGALARADSVETENAVLRRELDDLRAKVAAEPVRTTDPTGLTAPAGTGPAGRPSGPIAPPSAAAADRYDPVTGAATRDRLLGVVRPFSRRRR